MTAQARKQHSFITNSSKINSTLSSKQDELKEKAAKKLKTRRSIEFHLEQRQLKHEFAKLGIDIDEE